MSTDNPHWLKKVELIAVKGSMAVLSTNATSFQANVSKLRTPLDTVELEELNLRERAGVCVCCGSLVKVK